MATVYMYADETGDLGYDSAAPYFGLGTATYAGDHRDAIWQGFELRTTLERRGVRLQRGLHAKDDSNATRHEMFTLIRDQEPRFDTTFLNKRAAYPGVRSRGPVGLYRMAFELHFKEILQQVSNPGDEVFVVVGHLQTNAKRNAIYEAVKDACTDIAAHRQVVPCVWEAPSSWGIQVADYALWSTQRVLAQKHSRWHVESILPTLCSTFTPWGVA